MSLERPWLASYPQGVPAQIDVEEYPSIVAVLQGSLEKYRDRPAFANLGKVLTYAEVDRLSRQFAAYLLGELKLKKGDRVAIMMPNCLQYPIATFGILRAGLTVVNTNPMYTARELRHQLVDSGASAILVLDNFGAHRAGSACRHPGQAGHHHRARRHAALPQGRDRQLRAQAREEDGAGLRHSRRDPLQGRIDARPDAEPARRGDRRGRHRLPAIHRRHHRRGQGRDAHPSQPGREHAAGRGMGRRQHQVRRGDHRHRAAAVPHLRVDGERPGLHEVRRAQLPHHQPARHARLRQGTEEHPVHRHHRRQHAVQRTAQHARLRPGRFLAPAPHPRRRHGGAARGGRALEAGDRRAPWSKPTA